MERRLSELSPQFMFPADGSNVANGIIFDCPACTDHKIRVRFFNHPSRDPIKWDFNGNSFEDATITPSIDGTQDKVCKFHGHVTLGMVSW